MHEKTRLRVIHHTQALFFYAAETQIFNERRRGVCVFIPFNINRISRGAFDECTGLENIYYEGDEFLWREEISVKEYNLCN